jgi:integrase
MRGHIARKGQRYWVVVDIGLNHATGRRRQKWHGSWPTRKAAEQALPAIVGRLHDGVYVEPNRVTVRTFLREEWLPAIRSSLKPSTVRLYRILAEAYVIPRIGDVRLQQLGPGHLNRLYAELLDSGKRDGSPLGAETTAKVHRLLHRALRDAAKWNRIVRNPATVADPPRARRSELRTWSAPELARFLERSESDPLTALWTFLATTGTRRGEALGLRWSDLDLEAAWATIRQTLSYVGTTPMISEPKTARSRRLIALPPETVVALRTHRIRQAAERLELGATLADDDLVFAHAEGTPLNPATVSRRFERLAHDAGLPRMTLHGLRHSWATLALLEGIPTKVVSEILGHSSTRVTEDVYQHVSPGMQADATTRVARLLRTAR